LKELNIAKTLVSKRKEKDITQDELASYIGVSKASVSKWETGQSYPDITFLPQLAAYFNISVDELINYQPQMLTDDIRKLYLRLSKDFAEKPFEDVLSEIRKITKKYFSCFPLLFQMGLILINHNMLSKDGKQQDIIREAVDIFTRIKSESDDFTLCKRSNVMEAVCYLMLGEPIKIIELLTEANAPIMNECNLLSVGYSMSGNIDKAKEILQVGLYQNLLSLLQNLTSLLQLEAANAKTANGIIDRIAAISDAFDVEHLHPATMLTVYLNLAAIFTMQNDTENALSSLQKYCDLAVSNIYPLTLHGDEFFDKIDEWLSELDLGVEAPRNEKTIKQGMIDGVAKNPAFAALSDNFRYKNIIEKLTTNLGG